MTTFGDISRAHFDYFNTQLTGIDAEKVKGAPNFAELWKKIEPIHNTLFLRPVNLLRRNLDFLFLPAFFRITFTRYINRC